MTCSSCGGYLQTRVDTLDLFSTAWRVIERPFKAFHTIAIARHKNYVLLLSALAGLAIVFTLFWAITAARYAESTLNILIAGFVVGPLFGIVLLLFLSILIVTIARVFGFHTRMKGTFAVVAYASIPWVFIGLFIFPVEVLTFGTYLFSNNPSPYTIKPLSFIVLLILHGTFALWNLLLLLVGIRVLCDASWQKAIAIWSISIAIICGIFYGTLQLLLVAR